MDGQCPNVFPLGWLFIITLRLRLSALKVLSGNLKIQSVWPASCSLWKSGCTTVYQSTGKQVCLGTRLLHKNNYLLDSLLCFLCYALEIICTKDFMYTKTLRALIFICPAIRNKSRLLYKRAN